MTRDEQKAVKELGKALEQAIKPSCKKYGYKSIRGYIYKVVDGYLYILLVSVPPIDLGKAISVRLWCKPLALDDIFGEVFEMKDTAKSQPLSFHVQGAFTAACLSLEEWQVQISTSEEIYKALDEIFSQTYVYISKYNKTLKTMQDFKFAISKKPNHILNSILCEIYEGNYKVAMQQINDAIASNQSGGFASGDKNIIEYAKDYCLKRL